MNSQEKLDSIEILYNAVLEKNNLFEESVLLLGLRNWLTDICEFDPASGSPVPLGITEVLDRITPINAENLQNNEVKDRLFCIVKHVNSSLCAIIKKMRDKILREHLIMPIYAAQEVDSTSVQWLSRKPGRTLREKLAGKPYIKAVHRKRSFDTSENRLTKSFTLKLEELLNLREEVFSTLEEDSLSDLSLTLQRWLRSDVYNEIGAWNNLPPNNTLLEDKNYRKIWDGWLWLQRLDDGVLSVSKEF